MSYEPVDYWKDALGEALCEVDAFHALTDEQMKSVAKSLSYAHEGYGMAFYQPSYAEHERSEVSRLERLLAEERSLVFCKTCQGSGREEGRAGPWYTNTTCWKCGGKGKHKP